jgi:hypothetical protein
MNFFSVQILVDSFASGQDAPFSSLAQLPFRIVFILAVLLMIALCGRDQLALTLTTSPYGFTGSLGRGWSGGSAFFTGFLLTGYHFHLPSTLCQIRRP